MKNLYLLTSFICGAIVMIVEIIGTKILTPFFGSGLFVWSSTITVAMLALSVGYFIGGRQADKIELLNDYLYKLVFIIGAILLFIYDSSAIIYFVSYLLDMKIAIFLSAFILLFPPLIFLGMISPIVLKLTTTEFKEIGKDLGFVSSVSTMGSLVGSLLAGFILLAYFSTKQIFFYCALTLLIISSSYFLKKRNLLYVGVMIVLVLTAYFIPQQLVEAQNEYVKKVDQKENFYGKVSVVDLRSPTDKNYESRIMLLDSMPQGQIDKKNGKSLFHYPYLIEEIIEQNNNNNKYKNILFVGIGAGLMPKSLEGKFNLKLVDINPIVVDFAQKYFDLKSEVVIDDARVFINKLETKQDVIVVDVFSGESFPSHLLTKEFMMIMNKKLNKDGLIIFNIIGEPYKGIASKSIIKTLASEFSSVNIFPLKEEKLSVINYIAVASNKKLNMNKNSLLENIRPKVSFNQRLHKQFNDDSIDMITDLSPYQDGEIVTDSFNRIDFYSLDERKEIRHRLMNFALAVN